MSCSAGGFAYATLGSLRTTIRAGWSSLHSCHQSPRSIHQPFSPWSSNSPPQRPHTSYSSFTGEFFFTSRLDCGGGLVPWRKRLPIAFLLGYFWVEIQRNPVHTVAQPVGRGPSSNTCPRCPLHREQCTSVRYHSVRSRSVVVSTALSSGAQKLGQPVPLSNFVYESNRSWPHPAHRKTPSRCSCLADSSPPVRSRACAEPDTALASASRAIPRRSLECPCRQSTDSHGIRPDSLDSRCRETRAFVGHRACGDAVAHLDACSAGSSIFRSEVPDPRHHRADSGVVPVTFPTSDGLTLRGWFVSRDRHAGIRRRGLQRQRRQSRASRRAGRRAGTIGPGRVSLRLSRVRRKSGTPTEDGLRLDARAARRRAAGASGRRCDPCGVLRRVARDGSRR